MRPRQSVRRPGTSSRRLEKDSAVSFSRGIGTLTVTPARFEEMLTFPDDCFLYKNWWNDLMDHRQKEAGKERAS